MNTCILKKPIGSLLVFIFFFALLLSSAWADGYPELKISLLSDSNANLTISDVDSHQFADRFVSSPPRLFIPLGSPPSWLRIVIDYPAGSKGMQWELDFNWNYLQSLDLFVPGPRGFTKIGQGDWNIYVNSIFKLPLPVGSQLVLYARIVNYNGANLYPQVRPMKSDSVRAGDRGWFLGILFGIMAAMLVYNAFLYVSLKDASYLWYVAHLAFLMFNYLYLNGLYASVFGSNGEATFVEHLRIYYSGNAFLFFCVGMFTRTFLMTKELNPRLNIILLGQIALASFFLPLALFASLETAGKVSSLVGLAATVLVPICGVVSMVKGFKPARIFVFGWCFHMIGGFMHILVWVGVLAPTAFNVHALQGGTIVEVMVMSLALAYRIKLLREEKLQVEQEKNLFAEKSAFFSVMLENSQLGIGLVKDNSFSWMNTQLNKMFGINDHSQKEDIVELPGFKELIEEPETKNSSDGFMQEGKVFVDDAWKNIRVLGKPVHESPLISGTVWVFEDVSEQKRLEQLKRDLDHVVHHDLRSPLGQISSLQNLIGQIGSLTEKQVELLDMIGLAATRGLKQLNSALSLYKIEAGTFKPEVSKVNMLIVVSNVLAELNYYLRDGARKVQVSFVEKSEGDACIWNDEILVHVVLCNIIKNALEATPAGEEVTIIVEKNETLCVRVTNLGEVPQCIRDRFFEKFVTCGKKKGTGIGTYSARLIARALGGDVVLNSSIPGATTVSVCFMNFLE